MPRVKEVRKDDSNFSKDVTTRSKAKIKSKVELSTPPMMKKRKISRAVPQTKSMSPKKQHKKEDTDVDECNENLTQNKNNKNSARNNNKEKINDKKEKVEHKPTQIKKTIILDDSSKDSVDDSVHESEDDYEPDTSDEEEYRSRSYFW